MDKMLINSKKYFQTEQNDIDWGLYVLGVGKGVSAWNAFPRKGRILQDYALVYVFKGGGILETLCNDGTEKISRTVEEGSFIMLFPDVWHCYYPREQSEWEEFWVIFNGNIADSIVNKKFFSTSAPLIHTGIRMDLLQQFSGLLDTAISEQIQGKQRKMSAIVLDIMGSLRTIIDYPPEKNYPSPVAKAAQYIEKNFLNKINGKTLSSSSGLSYSHFRRLFKQTTGASPHQYQITVKINKAKEMLSAGKYSIKEISEQLNFKDQYYFSRIFSRKTGVSPSKWTGL